MPTETELIELISKLRDALMTIHGNAGDYHGVSSTSRHVIHEIIKTARDASAEALALVNDDDGYFIFDRRGK